MRRMKPAIWARLAHKWLAWLIGVQALLWMLSGLYMTAIAIDIIHGDHLVKREQAPLALAAPLIDIDVLAARYPGLSSFRLKRLMGREVYELRHGAAMALVDARTGTELDPLDDSAVRARAAALYAGSAPIHRIELLTHAPAEVANRPAPLWRVEFSDRKETTLYLSPNTGELLAKRHDLWRWFDLLWMLHIMDYDERSDINNALLRVASSLGLAFAASGLWLLAYSFRRKRVA